MFFFQNIGYAVIISIKFYVVLSLDFTKYTIKYNDDVILKRSAGLSFTAAQAIPSHFYLTTFNMLDSYSKIFGITEIDIDMRAFTFRLELNIIVYYYHYKF